MKKTNKILTAIVMMIMVITMAQPIEASAATSARPVIKATQKVVSKGKKLTLKATHNGRNVTKKATWKSSNKKVATIKNGKLTAKKAGTTYVTATYKRTSKRVKITVAETKLNKTSLKLTVGKTYKLKATYNKKAVKPTFKTSNAAVATVSKAGVVNAKKAGTATITAIYKSKGSKVSCKVNVTKAATPAPTPEPEPEPTPDVPVCNHVYDNGVLTTPPTAEADGVTTYTCTKCGATKTEAYTSKVWDEVVTVTETCYVCICGKPFGLSEYGNGDAAVAACGQHAKEQRLQGDYTHNSYSTETVTHTYTIRHNVIDNTTEIIH